MWLWWIVSLIILVICIIFAVRVYANSRRLHRLISFGDTSSPGSPNSSLKLRPIAHQDQEIAELHMKLRILEGNAINYSMQLSRLNERVEIIEGVNPRKVKPTTKNDDEDWEELYFESLDKNEKLENELDLTRNKLEELEASASEMIQIEKDFSAQQSNLEQQLVEAHSLQYTIVALQHKLEGAEEREKQLRSQLAIEENIRKELKHMRQQYARVQSEATELRNRILEVNKRDILLQQKLAHLNELESSIQNSEYDKTELQKTVGEIILENELLATKLTELQEKLSHEKYV